MHFLWNIVFGFGNNIMDDRVVELMHLRKRRSQALRLNYRRGMGDLYFLGELCLALWSVSWREVWSLDVLGRYVLRSGFAKLV